MQVVSFRSVERIPDAFGDHRVRIEPKQRYSEAELIERSEGADALFVHSENAYTESLFERLPAIRAVGKAGSGIDNIDVEAATANDVAVVHTPGMNGVAVAEFTVGAIVTLARNFHGAERHLRDGGWRSEQWWGTELRGKTVGFVGLGAAGFETAKRLEAFGVDFLVSDPYVSEERLEEIDGTRVQLPELLTNADIVTLHVRLTEETEGLLGHEEFDQLGSDSLVINTSRGKVIDTEALETALRKDSIGGAFLDVFHEEPPTVDDALFERDDLIVTPHLAGATVQTREKMLETTAKNVVRILEDESIESKYVANPSVL